MGKKVLITGITGQDAAYLAELLLHHGYEVYGSRRRGSSTNMWRLEELGVAADIKMLEMDLVEYSNILHVIKEHQFDEIYNLAAQSFVSTSFIQPLYTAEVDGLAVCRLLEAIKSCSPHTRFYQASTSEMFGKVRALPQKEDTPFYPRSPYGVAKLYAHWITVNYRESYGVYAVSGLLFNHESPLRGQEFVTRKITVALARIKYGQQDYLALGNLESERDWGFAGDYVRGMYQMLQQANPEDYVLASGKTYSVRTFVEHAAYVAGYDISWEGSGKEEVGIDKKTGKKLIAINPAFYRPSEVDILIGDASKAKQQLGWETTVSFEQLVAMMMQRELERVKEGISLY